MKKLLKSDYFLMFMSVVFAIFLWVYVSYNQNPVFETWVRGIPVTYSNETSELQSGKLVIIGGNIKTADLKLKGTRTALASVKTTNVVCNVNLGDVKSDGNYHIPLSVNVGVDGVEILQKSPYYIDLIVDRVVTEEKTVTANIVGEPKSGFEMGEIFLNPETVKITGPGSVVRAIDKVSATVDVTDASEDVSGLYKIKLYNESGKEIVDERISKNIEYSDVKCSILYAKSVKVIPVLSLENNSKGEPITVINTEPDTVTIMGNKGVIDNISELYTTPINTSDVFEDTVLDVSIDLSAYSENVVLKETSVKISLKPEIILSEEASQKAGNNENADVEENQ